jgi:hypothetical protein
LVVLSVTTPTTFPVVPAIRKQGNKTRDDMRMEVKIIFTLNLPLLDD